MSTDKKRGAWGSKLGFILAAAGSAVGLGNIWKFPYITGMHGGGLFVLIYLVAIVLIGTPVMIAEVLVGRQARVSPVMAFERLIGHKTAWTLVGLMGAFTGFLVLSYYSVIAGWTLHYIYLALTDSLSGLTPEAIKQTFGALYASGPTNLGWHSVFMLSTILIVSMGVERGIELAAKIMMPALILLLIGLVIYASFLPGFGRGVDFLFTPDPKKLDASGVLEAVGHSFFTLSVGMGTIMTYGSYLHPDDDAVGSSISISGLDTMIGLLACLLLFPVLFSAGLEPSQGPGLVFISIPIAVSQLPGGSILLLFFFLLLLFAALSSAISMLELVTATGIDRMGWSRSRATLVAGVIIYLLGIPSTQSGGPGFFGDGFWSKTFGHNFLDSADKLVSNYLMPIGGLLIGIYVAWVMDDTHRRDAFCEGSRFAKLYPYWKFTLRYITPLAMLVIFLTKAGVFAVD